MENEKYKNKYQSQQKIMKQEQKHFPEILFQYNIGVAKLCIPGILTALTRSQTCIAINQILFSDQNGRPAETGP